MNIIQRIDNYLNEARVKTTDADVFLDDYAPVFMYHPKEGLYWAVNDEDEPGYWVVYKNSKEIGNEDWSGYLPHSTLIYYDRNGDLNLDQYIRGRISPGGGIIYIHDLKSRRYLNDYGDKMNPKTYDKMVDKAINAVYKYMKNYIK